MSYVGVHRRPQTYVAERAERHRTARVALVALFVVLSLCAALSILRTSLGALGGGSIDHWTFGSDEDRIAIALDGFDVLVHGGNESPLSLTSRGLTMGTATEVNTATYFQRQMRGPVNRIGATAFFDPAEVSGSGQVALLVSANPLPTDSAEFYSGVPNMGIHFVFDSEHWLMSVWRHDGGQDLLGAGSFATPLAGQRSVEIIRRDDEVAISLPDGKTVKFTDGRIGQWSNKWATWELYEKAPGINPAVIRQMWAGWQP